MAVAIIIRRTQNPFNWCRPAARREIPRKLCFSLLRNNRLRLPPDGAIQLPGRELHPPMSSGFHGVLLRQLAGVFLQGVVWLKVVDSESFPSLEIVKLFRSLQFLEVIGRVSLPVLLQVLDCLLHASTNEELPIKADCCVHIGLFALPHEGYIRWIADQIEQQAAPINLLETVGLALAFCGVVCSSVSHFSAEEFEQFCMVLSDDRSVWQNLQKCGPSL
jgi:hypothetical protein